MKIYKYILAVYSKKAEWSWIIFIFFFLLAGSIGHDPWKQDETYSFGIIYHFHTTGNWLVPINAGVPFMEKPPLYYWTAVIFCKLLGAQFGLPDAARLASVFYAVIAIIFIWKTNCIINHDKGREYILTPVLLFLGTLGIVRHIHDMFTDVALLAGTAIAFYGMALLAFRNEKWKHAGLWLGIGMGIAFLSKGLFIPIILAISGACLLALLPMLRTPNTVKALLFGAVAALPFIGIWPLLLWHDSHALFMQWFWDNNVGRFLGFSVPKLGADNEPLYIWYSSLWFAFPVFPLALYAAVKERHQWREPEYLVPFAVPAAGFLFLSISASARALYILPFVPMLSILAAAGLKNIPDRILRIWNGVVRSCFILPVALVWIIWASLKKNYSLPYVYDVFPYGFQPDYNQWLATIAAVYATMFFFYYMRLKGSSKFNTAALWLCGVATLWITVNTLLLPWTDETKSYRPVLTQMQQYREMSLYRRGCMNTYNLGESIAPMYEYFSANHVLNMVRDYTDADCPLLFTVTGRHEPADSFSGWKLVWKGSRVLDAKDEELRLYARH